VWIGAAIVSAFGISVTVGVLRLHRVICSADDVAPLRMTNMFITQSYKYERKMRLSQRFEGDGGRDDRGGFGSQDGVAKRGCGPSFVVKPGEF
jgi:hypothetical protein